MDVCTHTAREYLGPAACKACGQEGRIERILEVLTREGVPSVLWDNALDYIEHGTSGEWV